jgi:hypothetical protein
VLNTSGGVVDNYIVRIYRREKDNPRLLVGLVEEIGVSGKKAFNNLDDLWEILNAASGQPGRKGNGKRMKNGGRIADRPKGSPA